ncbi:hypothetical protein MTYP_00090 [Methylophilaceae bacterium]|nr:hypothetical protein MTYP_00090 [Methylophilaceae bacterium]
MEKCILLLDSDPTFCQEIKVYLASFGHKVIIATSIDAAIQCFHDSLPAILFLNVATLSLAAPEQIKNFSEIIDDRAKIVALTHHYCPIDNTAVELMSRVISAIHRDSPLSEFRYFLTNDKIQE